MFMLKMFIEMFLTSTYAHVHVHMYMYTQYMYIYCTCTCTYYNVHVNTCEFQHYIITQGNSAIEVEDATGRSVSESR